MNEKNLEQELTKIADRLLELSVFAGKARNACADSEDRLAYQELSNKLFKMQSDIRFDLRYTATYLEL